VTTPEIGDIAPDFTLSGITMVEGEPQKSHFTLSERRGRKVVLAFYPADNSPGCTAQLCSYQDELDSFRELGAEVWGISRQASGSHESLPGPSAWGSRCFRMKKVTLSPLTVWV
jgi:peroxiredoxin Q/BCP